MTPQQLAGIHAACFTLPPPWSAHDFAQLLASPHVQLIAEPAGFAMIRTVADEAELLTLAVDPAQRRQGIGARVLARAEAAMASAGATQAFLEVAATNDPARALYGALGWTQAGRRRGYYQASGHAPIDALILCKSLLPPVT